MTAIKKHVDSRSIKTKAKERAFWAGVAEGFGGPAMMGYELKVPSPSCLRLEVLPPASSVTSSREVARALSRAAKQILEKKELTSFVVRQKRLDGSGKMKDVDVLVVAPRQSAHGEPQK